MIPLRHSEFISHLKKIFSHGFKINSSILHFISSTYQIDGEMELKHLFKGPAQDEIDIETLLELIVYPDEPIQADIEYILEKYNFTSEDETHILSKLLNKQVITKFIISEKTDIENIPLPDSIVKKFLNRLKITKKIEASVLRAINQSGNTPKHNLIKAKLRNARFSFAENTTQFLIQFFERYPWDHPLFFKCQDFLYEFFCESPNDAPIQEALHLKVKFYQYQKQKAEALNTLIENSNVETVMLQGNRIAAMSIYEADERIETIRSIILYVYNIIVDIYHGDSDVKSDTISINQDFDKIIEAFK